MMTILSNEVRPADPDQLILRGLKKSAHSYSTYLFLTFWLKRRSVQKILFVSASLEFFVLGELYFEYSLFPGVMLASLMHSLESLFPDLQQLY
jgi:hypothetical protein